LLERLNYGAFLAHKTGLPILITGSLIEAQAMHDTLQRNFQIEPRWVDNRAGDTFENARDSAQLLKGDNVHRVILVTHATHMWRAVHEFTDAGMEVFPAPLGMRVDRDPTMWRYMPSPGALERACVALKELVGEPVRALLAATHVRRQ
jgi:uncharacterized SAM-binding protein YcdF (DUF218 family)